MQSVPHLERVNRVSLRLRVGSFNRCDARTGLDGARRQTQAPSHRRLIGVLVHASTPFSFSAFCRLGPECSADVLRNPPGRSSLSDSSLVDCESSPSTGATWCSLSHALARR